MMLLRTFVTALARTLSRATRSRPASPRADVTDGYEAWLAERFPGVY